MCAYASTSATVQRKPFEGENFRVSVQNENFAKKPFADYRCRLALAHAQRTRIHATCTLRIYWISKKFSEKPFTDDSETAKNVNVSFIKGFPLFSIILYHSQNGGMLAPCPPAPIPTPLWLVLHIRNHVVTCPFMANVTQSEP